MSKESAKDKHEKNIEVLQAQRREREAELRKMAEMELAKSSKDLVVSQTLNEVTMVAPENLPTIISQQMVKINELSKKIQDSKKAANDAQKVASAAKEAGVKLLKKKAAIEELQTVTCNIASAQSNVVDAMNVSFEYQQQLGQITQYLFALGVSNIAATRTVVQRLRLELQNAPKGKMSELARAEILSVIKQLQAQEDMASRQEKQSETLNKHEKMLASQVRDIDEHTSLLKKMGVAVEEQGCILSQTKELIAEQCARISQNTERNRAQDKVLLELKDIDKRQADSITVIASKNEEQDKKLTALSEEQSKQADSVRANISKIEEHYAIIAQIITKNNEQDDTLSRLVKGGETQGLLIAENTKHIEELLAFCSTQEVNNGEMTAGKERLEIQVSALETLQNKYRKMLLTTSVGTAIAIALVLVSFFV